MDCGGENADGRRVVVRNVDKHVVGENGMIEEGEEAVFAGFNSSDVAGEASELVAKFLVWFSKNPPEAFSNFPFVLISLGFHRREKVLKYSGMVLCQFLCGEAKRIDYLDFAGFVGEVFAVSIIVDNWRLFGL